MNRTKFKDSTDPMRTLIADQSPTSGSVNITVHRLDLKGDGDYADIWLPPAEAQRLLEYLQEALHGGVQ